MKSKIFLQKAIDGLSQAKAAEKIGITQQAISHYSTGRRVMDNYTCFRVAEILGVDPATVVAAAEADREKNKDRKNYWTKHAAAALLTGLAVTNFVTPEHAEAAQTIAHTAIVSIVHCILC